MRPNQIRVNPKIPLCVQELRSGLVDGLIWMDLLLPYFPVFTVFGHPVRKPLPGGYLIPFPSYIAGDLKQQRLPVNPKTADSFIASIADAVR
jgi:hypothetical protein